MGTRRSAVALLLALDVGSPPVAVGALPHAKDRAPGAFGADLKTAGLQIVVNAADAIDRVEDHFESSRLQITGDDKGCGPTGSVRELLARLRRDRPLLAYPNQGFGRTPFMTSSAPPCRDGSMTAPSVSVRGCVHAAGQGRWAGDLRFTD